MCILEVIYVLMSTGLSYTFNKVMFFFKQKTAYEMRISDWSSDVCSSDLSSDRIAKVIIFGRFGLTNASLRKFSSTSATRLISIWSDSPGRAFLKGVGSKAVKGGS